MKQFVRFIHKHTFFYEKRRKLSTIIHISFMQYIRYIVHKKAKNPPCKKRISFLYFVIFYGVFKYARKLNQQAEQRNNGVIFVQPPQE